MTVNVVRPPPTIPDSFIGREAEIIEIEQRLHAERLVVLTGPGGVGKTRLAQVVAGRLFAHDHTCIVCVSLESIDAAELVLPTLARALDIHEVQGESLQETLRVSLEQRSMVVVLDNFEHVIGGASEIASLLAVTPGLRLLITSRVPLSIRGEQVMDVRPLQLPDTDARGRAEDLGGFDAIRLFVERAHAADASFDLNDDVAPTIADICRKLDGLPLAIELAATWMRVLGPSELLRRLDSGQALPARPRPDAPSRQRTVRDTVAWSVALLSERNRRLFRALSVFAGSVSLPAAEAVAKEPGQAPESVMAGMADLVDASLLRRTPAGAAGSRYSMLRTIREFGLRELETSGAADAVRDKFINWCLALAEREPTWRMSRARLGELEQESDNMAGALQCAIDSGQGVIGLRLTAGLWPVWLVRGRYAVGRAMLAKALSAPDVAQPSAERAIALFWSGYLAYRQADFDAARRLAEETVRLGQHLSAPGAIGRGQLLLGNVARHSGQLDLAQTYYEQAEAAAVEEPANPEGGAWLSTHRAMAFFEQGAIEAAEQAASKALNVIRQVDCPLVEGLALQTLARVAATRQHWDTAVLLLEDALRLQESVSDATGILWTTRLMAEYEFAQDHKRQARRWASKALTRASDWGDRPAVARGLALLGAIVAVADPRAAVRLASACDALTASMGGYLTRAEEARIQQWLRAARAELGEVEYDLAWTAGRSEPLDGLIATALSALGDVPPPGEAPASESRAPVGAGVFLTSRECEIVQLVALGRSTEAIASDLVISRGTVRSHVEHVLTKLQLHSRAQLAVWAVQHGFRGPDPRD